MKRAMALLALTALAPGMGGCVAAIPIASAALMGESALSGNRAKDDAPVPALASPARGTAVEPAAADAVGGGSVVVQDVGGDGLGRGSGAERAASAGALDAAGPVRVELEV